MAEEYFPTDHEYTDAEIAAVGEGMKKLPTYIQDGGSGSVSSTQMEAILILAKIEHRPEQVACYKYFWDRHNKGRISVDGFTEGLRTAHKKELMFNWLVNYADKNEDGFINADEFAHLKEIMVLFNPRVAAMTGCSYETFRVEADSNRDGKVSVDECVAWLEKIQKKGQK